MKAEHRHELKTNSLAEWLSDFPHWVRENIFSVAIIVAAIVVAGGLYIWRAHHQSAQHEEQQRFTSLINQVSNRKMQILGGQGQGAGSSSLLFEPAGSLEAFANSTSSSTLAALALIKQAEALRTELHYRTEAVTPQNLAEQIGRAKQSYANAVKNASDNPSLMAAAKIGLGLCEEDLGNFDEAQRIYGEVVNDPTFEGTVGVNQAQLRLEIMNDYKKSVAFRPKPRPKPQIITPSKPVPIGPVDINSPTAAGAPVVKIAPADANAPSAAKQPVLDADSPAKKPDAEPAPVEPKAPAEAADANTPAVTAPPAIEPEAPAKAVDADSTPQDPNSALKATNPNVRGR
ncbi:MAG: hypothetical protein JW720_05900 [Sedimentisphaerales bacterium]|nr:hypothetical protein [Sedimentisphaerales bacterium]